MARSPSIRGNVVPFLTITVSGSTPSAAINLADDVINAVLVDGEGDPLTVSDYASGTSSKALECEFLYSGKTGAIFDFLWKNSGKTATIVYGQFGNGTAAADKPVITATATLPAKPNTGTSAGLDEATFESTIQFDTYDRQTL
jgi:hypothetical protein